ncbi:PREDICTED: pentatricopeptide repeat-containing protein At1g02150 [Nelumbo nucifera]|uniref:Pentatricopeptide repeat-containing protein At1g02150 n=1 Tax=Nelumbo nucifera TaxID=4432 RepID=A0A1U7YZK1_NELNU|nr:PREDICTED: pentatricopeptide repeat-containing protein At1g02150 [Nelumbo nucifera]
MIAYTALQAPSPLQHLPLSSTSHYSPVILGVRRSIVIRTDPNPKNSISCSISQVHNYGTVDYERKPVLKWNSLYRRISLMENPELGSSTVLDQWEKEGRKLSKWVLSRVVKELRKFRRYKFALEVYEWMTNQGDRFRVASSDAAIQLDLISKVHGISTAEDYFSRLPETLKDRRTYGSLLNAYAQSKMREKAENVIEEMRKKGYANHPLPYNVMMTLYMNLNEYEKANSLISEMMEKKIPLDIYSYNIWLSSCGAMGSMEKMEQVFEQMSLDGTINPNWTTYSTMATMYIKMGYFEKAKDCLKKVEIRITGRDRMPYHYLLSLYGGIGSKEEVYRIWNKYKSNFPSIPNLGYHAMIASLVRLGDISGAEIIYEEWLSVRSNYDPRICNLLIGWYVREGSLEKAETFLSHVTEVGGKLNSNTWEIIAEGHIKKKQIVEALSCMKKASVAEGAKNWRPKLTNVSAFLSLCEEESDIASKDALIEVLRQVGCLENATYKSLVSRNGRRGVDLKLSLEN